MKKCFKLFGLITLICFSFFYTDKVISVVSEQDPLKMQISNLASLYKISPNEAIVTSNTIIPGNNGKEVNVNKSYKKMKKNNIFNENLLVYDTLYPEYTLSSSLDKYVIRGSINKKEVSILFIVESSNNLSKIINILNNKNVVGNLFIEYKYLNSNISTIKEINNHNIYSYQENYSYDTLTISNNIIKRISDTDPRFCFSKKMDENNLSVCSYSDMNLIIPSIYGDVSDIMKNIENGSIILIDSNINMVNKLSYIIDFIVGKGYKIVGLDELFWDA